MKKIYATLIAAFGFIAFAQAADVTKSGEITSDETWTSDNTYFLDGYVVVTDGATLTIEPGTVVKGLSAGAVTSGDAASALVISRGSKLMAEGTASEPIIFTSEFDDVEDADDIDLSETDASRGLWGGVIILGRAPIGDNASEATIEGLPEQDNTKYGGSMENDNSGSLKYVSIRHGGSELAPDEEINGLTLGGVGSGTTLEHIEVIYNFDDGIEFFGGSVNLKWATVAFCGDDSYDWDLGWQGKGQFWFAYGGTDEGDHGGELDGAKPDDNDRYVTSEIYNFTFIGGWDGNRTDAKNEHGILMRDGTAGVLANGIVYGYNNYALQIEERDGEDFDSYSKMQDDELQLLNNIWYAFGEGNSWDDALLATPDNCEDCDLTDLKAHLTSNNNEMADPGIDRNAPAPNRWSLAATKQGAAEPDAWYTDVDYIGALEIGRYEDSWIAGWTAFDEYTGGDLTSVEQNPISQSGVYPNPANGNANLSFNLTEGQNVNITVVDLSGKTVLTVANSNFAAGTNNVQINTQALEAGVYFINITSEAGLVTEKMIVE